MYGATARQEAVARIEAVLADRVQGSVDSERARGWTAAVERVIATCERLRAHFEERGTYPMEAEGVADAMGHAPRISTSSRVRLVQAPARSTGSPQERSRSQARAHWGMHSTGPKGAARLSQVPSVTSLAKSETTPVSSSTV